MLFQIYGDGAGWQLLGWVLVFAGLVFANEFEVKWEELFVS